MKLSDKVSVKELDNIRVSFYDWKIPEILNVFKKLKVNVRVVRAIENDYYSW